MPIRRPRLPVLVSLIALVTVAILVYSTPNAWSLNRIYIGRSIEEASPALESQILDTIRSLNAGPTTLPPRPASAAGFPTRPAFEMEQAEREKIKAEHPEEFMVTDEPAQIVEDSTSVSTSKSVPNERKKANDRNKPKKEQEQDPDNPDRHQSAVEIPNIFHFTHLQTSTNALDLGFQQFIAIYSAYYYCNPSKIYIHTNVDPKAFRNARGSNNQWTRKIAHMPMVQFNHETAPNNSRSGVQITKLAHQSDFIRTRVMKKWGGIFMDEDSYLLKDLAPLRRAGYNNVVARQVDGNCGCGMFLSVPKSKLVSVYQELQHKVYDGKWTTHSVDLFTRLIDEFWVFEKEVLVMDQNAFFPLSWKSADLETIYKVGPHDNTTTPSSEFNLTNFVNSFDMKVQNTGKQTFKSSYALHGFNSEVKESAEYFGDFRGITLEYVLARNSNFARAIYPAIKHALTDSTLGEYEITYGTTK